METQSIPWQVFLLSKCMVLLTFAKLRRRGAASLLPRVEMTSGRKDSRPSRLMIIPNKKRNLNNTKTEQLPILEQLLAFQGRNITLAHPDAPHMHKYGKFGEIPDPLTRT